MRFPGFENEWKKEKLGNLCSKIGSGKTPKGGENVYQTDGIPFIRSQNVNNNCLLLDETHISEEVHEKMKSSKVLSRDILLNITGGSIGRSCVVPRDFQEGNVNQHVSIIRLKQYNPNFVQCILSSEIGQKLVFQGQTGSGREGLNFQSIKNFKIYFPSVSEQQKIASFLTLIDNRIETQNKIIDRLESLMLGFRQKIFSQELRFLDDDGDKFSNWDEKKLSEIGKIVTGKTPKTSKKELWNGNIDFITPTDIKEGKKFQKNVSRKVKETKSIKILPIGTVLYTCIASIGKIAITTTRSISNQQINSLIVNCNFFNEFVYYALLNQTPRIKATQANTTLPIINRTDFSKIKIKLPPFQEQKKIANFLSLIDKKLEKEKLLLAQYQEQKKYLLQNLFI